MTHDELKALYNLAVEARDLAHAAYESALNDPRGARMADPAWQALLKANQVKAQLYNALVASV